MSAPAMPDTRHLVDEPTGGAQADRQAIQAMLVSKGFEHALTTVAHAVSVELVNAMGPEADRELAEMAGRCEVAVIDSLVAFAKANGWRRRS